VNTDTPNWGIEPVPNRLRVLGTADQTMLWGNLGVSLLVLVVAQFLVPALSLRDALIAVLVGSLIGNAMLGAAGLIGADGRVPAMVLLRSPLGERGSYLPTALNVAQCLGWATFELIIIAAAAGALSDELFGFEAKWAWTIFFGAAAAALALMGPIGVVRRFLRRYALWAVLASLVYLTGWTLANADLGELWAAQGEGGTSVWLGIDLVIAITVSWVPLVADYTRFSRDRRSALVGSGVGYFLGAMWMLLLGIVLVLDRGVTDAAQVPAVVAAAGLAAALALLAVTVDETDEAFANVYSTAVSAQNIVTRADRRVLAVCVGAVATLLALTFDIAAYEPFLFLIGAVFVPLVGVFVVAYYSTPRGAWDTSDTAPARPVFLLPWVAGFLAYQLTLPTFFAGPGAGWTAWWTARQADLGIDPANGWSASLVSLAVAVAITALICLPGRLRRRRTTA
jgi:nucleobase:cation symporter-1, NCS1 family